MERLGLYGGSFNPVTCGHLLVAQAALEELGLDRLFFIPAAHSPFKPENALAPAAARLRLLRLALAGQTRCEIDDQEIQRGGVSYSIATVREYRWRFPQAELYYLIGMDNAAALPQWREAEALAALAIFVVVPRPGQAAMACPAPFRSVVLKGIPFGVSASQVRERVRQRLPLAGLVPEAVAEALRNSGLYL